MRERRGVGQADQPSCEREIVLRVEGIRGLCSSCWCCQDYWRGYYADSERLFARMTISSRARNELASCSLACSDRRRRHVAPAVRQAQCATGQCSCWSERASSQHFSPSHGSHEERLARNLWLGRSGAAQPQGEQCSTPLHANISLTPSEPYRSPSARTFSSSIRRQRTSLLRTQYYRERESCRGIEGSPTSYQANAPFRSVTLYLPKKRSLNHLTVRLVGRQDISWGDSRPYESSICLDKEVALFSGKDEVMLDKGEHHFSFSIIVPSSTPTCERCQWGRVRHTVVAKAKGLGQLGGDVLSTEKPLFLIVNVSVTRFGEEGQELR